MHVVRFVADLVLWLFFGFVAISASFYNTFLLIFFFLKRAAIEMHHFFSVVPQFQSLRPLP